jgi:phage/plasmid-like protein (TIGR03299 family)
METKKMNNKNYKNVAHLIPAAFDMIGQEAKGETGMEVLKNAKMDFTINTEPLYDSKGNELKTKFMRVFREDTNHTLSVMTKTYNVLQNSELVGIADRLIPTGNIDFDRIGMVNNGERLFVSFHTPDTYTFQNGDVDETLESYFYLQNTNDGSGGVKIVPSPRRLFCKNQSSLLEGFLKRIGIDSKMLVIRHSSLMHGKIDELILALGLVNQAIEQYAVESEMLLATEMKVGERTEYYIDTLGLKVEEELISSDNPYGLGTRGKNTLEQLIEIEGYERNNIGVMNNTQYQAYNVVSDYIDHAWTVDKTGKINEKRVESAIIGPKARTKSKAWETLMTSMVIQ